MEVLKVLEFLSDATFCLQGKTSSYKQGMMSSLKLDDRQGSDRDTDAGEDLLDLLDKAG
jgi:hypothetical protein